MVALGLLVLALLSGSGCSSGGEGDGDSAEKTAASSEERPTCGSPTVLEPVSPEIAPGARAGPLWLIAGGEVGEPATVALEPSYPTAIYPTKVLIFIREPLQAPIALTGARCADGKPLRFWYRSRPLRLPSNPSSSASLARAGDALARLDAPDPSSVSSALEYRGYVLFSSPGNWVVRVKEDGKTVGAAVFRVVS